MKVYIGHSREFDYKKELYDPIISSNIFQNEDVIFPHLTDKSFDSSKMIEESDLFIAEVSYPSLGLGIEIGRAETKNKKILCIYKESVKMPSSLKYINSDNFCYENEDDMINKLEEYIKCFKMKHG